MEFTCTARQAEQQIVVTVTGEIDLAVYPRLRAEAEIWAGKDTDVVLDCRQVTFMDSMGVRFLVQVRQMLSDTGHTISLANPSRPVMRVLELAGLRDLFAYTHDEHEPATDGTAS